MDKFHYITFIINVFLIVSKAETICFQVRNNLFHRQKQNFPPSTVCRNHVHDEEDGVFPPIVPEADEQHPVHVEEYAGICQHRNIVHPAVLAVRTQNWVCGLDVAVILSFLLSSH